MAKTYRVNTTVRILNGFMKMLIRLGLNPKRTYLLTTRGRKSSKLHSTPVSLVEDGASRWLVAPYGVVGWVHNARAAGQVTLSQRNYEENASVIELDPTESAPVLKKYYEQEPFARPYFDAGPNASTEAFEAEASRHPVFLLQS